MPSLFRESLRNAIEKQNHPLCIGVDPDLPTLRSFLHNESVRFGVEEYLKLLVQTILDSTKERCHFVKFQSAFFESYGAKGIAALKKGIDQAHSRGFFCILDAKRGDIASTMTAYGRSAFDYLNADALTITPYMGWDVVQPLVPWLKKGKGVFVVWLTSNSTASETQDLDLHRGSTTSRYLSHIAGTLLKHARDAHVEDAIGFVAGATRIETHQAVFDELGPSQSFLIPGVGIQGGSFSKALRLLIETNPLSLVPISRGIVDISDESSRHINWESFASSVTDNLDRHINEWTSPVS